MKKALDFFGARQDHHCAPIERTRPNPHCIRLWKRILSTLGAAFAIVLLGLSGEQTYPELGRFEGTVSLVGKTNVEHCLGVIERSIGVLSVDSFAAHVALAYSVPVAVLMVKPYCQHNSYPEDNLFSVREGVEDALQEFFASRTEVLI